MTIEQMKAESNNQAKGNSLLHRRLRGALLSFLLFISAYFGSIFLMGPFLWLFFFNLAAFTRVMSELVALWMDFAMGCLHLLTNVRVKVFGDTLRRDESFVVIMNHRTRLDWIYWWVFLRSSGCLADMKIILKDELSKVPGAGWAMQNASFVFIKRRWETDRSLLEKFTQHFAFCARRTKYLLFPEGTDLAPFTKSRSDAFADKSGVARLNYVLHPRTTGFVHLCSLLRDTKRLDAVYDFTVAYPSGRGASSAADPKCTETDFGTDADELDVRHVQAPIPHKEHDLVLGNLPSEIRYYIRRFDATQLHADDQLLAEWLTKRWNRKESFLRDFYRKPDFDNTPLEDNNSATDSGNAVGPGKQTLDDCSKPQPIFESSMDAYLITVFVLWCSFVLCVTWLLVVTSWARWYFLVLNIIYLVATICYGGMHQLVVSRASRLAAHAGEKVE